jgi:probable rRNA maturation factor
MSTPDPKIQFHFHEVSFPLLHRKLLKQFIVQLFKSEGKGLASLSYVFCTDAYLLEINKQYLHHDYYTDIVTFELSETFETEGEVYISIDRVKENATKENCSFKEELLRVVFHGSLHLCGFKDKTSYDNQIMRQKEDHYLKNYFSQLT